MEKEAYLQAAGKAQDGRSAVEMTETFQPDVVVKDIAVPQLNGLDAAAQIARRHPEVGVVTFSIHDEEDYLVRDLSAGVRGYC